MVGLFFSSYFGIYSEALEYFSCTTHLPLHQNFSQLNTVSLMDTKQNLEIHPVTEQAGMPTNEPCYEKTGFLQMRKQRRRSASR